MPDPVLSLNDEGCELSGVEMWEDNEALSVTDVVKMTEVSLNSSVVIYIKVLCYLTGWGSKHIYFDFGVIVPLSVKYSTN